MRQLAAAFDCQFIANLAETSSSQRSKEAFSFEYTRNIRQTIQGGSKLPHSMAPFGRIFKKSMRHWARRSQWPTVGQPLLRGLLVADVCLMLFLHV
jgi:hypothetical protein